MRRVLLFAALLALLPGVGWAQGFIHYTPPTLSPFLTYSSNVLTLQDDGTAAVPVPQSFYVYNFCDGAACATGYERGAFYWSANTLTISTEMGGTGSARQIQISPGGGQAIKMGSLTIPGVTDAIDLGNSSNPWRNIGVQRSLQGSKSKALTDNTATAFVRLTVADDDYEGCGFVWTAYAEDADTDARQTRTGRTHVAILNNSGTEAAAFSTGDEAVLVTAGTLTCTFDGNSASADTIDLRATCNTSLDAAAETLTFEYRLDCPSTLTVTPQ